MTETHFWLLCTVFSTAILSFYSMQEMACISCNKLRLNFAASQKKRWALWLEGLLEKPQLLFSTTLVGVNVATMISSESARRFFESVNLDPNLAPLASIPFLLVFGELIPMFAARLYPDHASRLGIPLLYASAKLISPFIALFSALFTKRFQAHERHFLSRDELQKLLEEHQAGYLGEEITPENDFISNIFSLRSMQAFQLMQRLDQVVSLSTHTTVGELRTIMKKSRQPIFPVFHRTKSKIVGIVYLQKLLNATSNKRVDEYTESAIFIPHNLPALEVIRKIQEEGQTGAVVINPQGEAKGLIFLDDLVDEVFGSLSKKKKQDLSYLEKTVSADMLIQEFNATYDTKIDPDGCKTFKELVEKSLGRHPHVNDTLQLDALELIVKETSLFKAKTVQIRSKTP